MKKITAKLNFTIFSYDKKLNFGDKRFFSKTLPFIDREKFDKPSAKRFDNQLLRFIEFNTLQLEQMKNV